MKRRMSWALCVLASALLSEAAEAFCGFYVAKADTRLFNRASQVVQVRDEDRTVLTMVNDFQGDPQEFAMVVPVPTFIEREQIHVGDRSIIDHLDAYTSPRLVEYFDGDPCARIHAMKMARAPLAMLSVANDPSGAAAIATHCPAGSIAKRRCSHRLPGGISARFET